MHDIVSEIAISMVAAMVFAYIAKLLRQPVILGYMIAGLVIGPAEGFGWISPGEIEELSELGLILLLFMIGLEIDLKTLRKAGRAVTVAGLTQFIICFVLGLLAAPLFGFHFTQGSYAPIYFGVAAALSSTMIVVKLLYDKFELETVSGRITLGILVFQDIWAILFLGVQPNLAHPALLPIVFSLLKGIGLVFFSLAASRFALPLLFRSIAKIPELMVIGALGWCFGISMLASWLGLSREMGALIAGVSISTFPYNLDVISKVVSLRDFFITLFFVTLGARISRPTPALLLTALAICGFVVLSRLISVTPVLSLLKMGNRVSFVPALNLSQISEFSLVICALGVTAKHVDEGFLSIIVYVLVLTSVLSTYVIGNNHEIFEFVQPALRKIGFKDLDEQAAGPESEKGRSILFLGFAHDASSLLHNMIVGRPELTPEIGVVDFNPEVKHELDRRKIPCTYGDVSHLDTLHHAHVHSARVLISTVPDMLLKGTSNARLLRTVRRLAPHASVIVTALHFAEALRLYESGAAFVYMPRIMGVAELQEAVESALAGKLNPEHHKIQLEMHSRAEVLP